MFKTFLNETTIHGLKHLLRDRSVPSLFRLIWFVCIVGSCTLAIIIIMMNLKNWENSPSVVTSVDNLDIEDNLEYPIVTICPKTGDFNSYLMRHVKKTQRFSDDFANYQVWNLIDEHLEGLQEANEPSFQYRSDKPIKDIASPCLDNTTNLEVFNGQPCQLIRIINSAVKTRNLNTVKFQALLADIFFNGASQLDIETLAMLVAEKANVTVQEVMTDTSSLTNAQWADLIKYYTYFFPLEGPDQEGNLIPLPLRGLPDFKLGLQLPPVRDNPNLDAYLQTMQVLYKEYLRQKILYRKYAIDTLLSEQPLTDPMLETFGLNRMDEQVLSVFDSISSQQQWFAPTRLRDSILCPNDPDRKFLTSKDDSCQDSDFRKTCAPYCDLVKEYLKHEDYLVNLFKQTTPRIQDGVLDAFPMCKFGSQAPKGNCWQPMLTETGPCFSTYQQVDPPIINGSGEAANLMILLNQRAMPRDLDDSFVVKINPPRQFTNGRFINYPVIELDGKDDLDITVDVTRVMQTTPEFKAMSIRRRKCLYPDEQELQLFPVYSQANCILECAWNHAANQCSCVPWYLKDHYPGHSLCNLFGNNCFRYWIDLRHRELKHICVKQCMPDCDDMELQVTVNSKPISWYDTNERYDWICTDETYLKDDLEGNLTCQYALDAYHADNPYLNLTTALKATPNTLKNSLRVINIGFKKMITISVVKTATITLIDTISNIGGTLGLFLGFSLLSGIEMVYFVALALLKKLRRKH